MRRSLRRLGVRRLALLLNVVMLLVLVLLLVVRHGTIVVEIRVVHVLVISIPSLAAVLAPPPPALAHILMILIGMVASMIVVMIAVRGVWTHVATRSSHSAAHHV